MNDPAYTIFDSDTGITILKWAITILVAGFIAQFGKKFATFLIERAKRLKGRKIASTGKGTPGTGQLPFVEGNLTSLPASEAAAVHKAEVKANKKLMKSLAKERKK
jgi:hypothetical protein